MVHSVFVFLPLPLKNLQQRQYVIECAVCPFIVRLLTRILRLCTYWIDFSETWHMYSPCECALLKRSSKS